MILRHPHNSTRKLPAELDRITLKALAKKQEQRYQTADELIVDLDLAQAEMQGRSGQAVTRLIAPSPATRPTSALATLSDIFQRPRLSVGYVAAALLALAAIVLAILVLDARQTCISQPRKLSVHTTAELTPYAKGPFSEPVRFCSKQCRRTTNSL